MPIEEKNLYDFDGTIYNGNSSIDFFIFCLFQNTNLVKYIPKNLSDLIRVKTKLLELSKSQNDYCQFLTEIENIDSLILNFWKYNNRKIKRWYLSQRKNDDIIITCSPDFLITPICNHLKVNSIATRVDKNTGKILELCYQDQKLKMLNEKYPNEIFDSFYTDSLNDDQILFQKARNSYLVKGNKRIKIKNN